MLRLWKGACLALAVVASAIFAISCGSGNTSYRVIDAIANYNYQATGGFDLTMNGSLVFSSVQFTNINPSGKDAYQSISGSGDTLSVFAHGDSLTGAPVFSSSLNLSGHTQYTVLLMGNNTTNPYVAQPFTDDNTIPASNDFALRIIHASNNMPSGQPSGGVDIYIVGSPNVVTGPNPPPANANLNFGQASSYIAEPTGTWYLVVTNHNFHTPIINPTAYAPGALQIHTIVLVDGPSGFGYGTPLIYNDLN